MAQQSLVLAKVHVGGFRIDYKTAKNVAPGYFSEKSRTRPKIWLDLVAPTGEKYEAEISRWLKDQTGLYTTNWAFTFCEDNLCGHDIKILIDSRKNGHIEGVYRKKR